MMEKHPAAERLPTAREPVTATRLERAAASLSRERLAVGLSSGTSADGIDAALIAVRGEGATTSVRLERFAGFAYPPELRRAVLAIAAGEAGTAAEFARLDAALGECFAEAAAHLVRGAGHEMNDLEFIASHGQTIAHAPRPHRVFEREIRATWQAGSLAVIAERTGVTTVGNFRARDVAAGGEGAPLLPVVDWILFRSNLEGRALLNVGGIANITFLASGAGPDDVVAYDLGPGNMVMDALVAELSAGGASADTDGKMAARGTVARDLLEELLDHPFFERPPPRSTGREEFGGVYVERLMERASALPADDLLATAAAFTARAARREMARWAPRAAGDACEAGSARLPRDADDEADELRAMEELAAVFPAVYLSGGGGENPTLTAMLRDALRPMRLRRFDDLGVPSRAREAVSFAVLGNECLAGNAANLPRVTGARRRVVLGEIVRGKAIER